MSQHMTKINICSSETEISIYRYTHNSLSLTKHSKNKEVKGKSHCSFIRSSSLGSFWAVNYVAGFCHVAKMIMMNEMILSYGATHYRKLLQKHFSFKSSLCLETFQTP